MRRHGKEVKIQEKGNSPIGTTNIWAQMKSDSLYFDMLSRVGKNSTVKHRILKFKEEILSEQPKKIVVKSNSLADLAFQRKSNVKYYSNFCLVPQFADSRQFGRKYGS